MSPWYDSMLAKVIAHGATRTEALDRLARALDRTALLGIATNRAFLARVLRQPQFAQGAQVSTAFVGRHFPDAGSRASSPDATTWALAAWLSIAATDEARSTPPRWRHWSTGLPAPNPWRLRWHCPPALAASSPTEGSGHAHATPGGAKITQGEAAFLLEGQAVAPCRWGQVEIDGQDVAYRYAWDESTLWLQTHGGDFAFDCRRREARRRAGAEDASNPEVRSGINGRVIDVCVTPGATVAAGERLVVLEAMKMEHEIRAARAGRIATVGVMTGDQVTPGQWLVRFEGES